MKTPITSDQIEQLKQKQARLQTILGQIRVFLEASQGIAENRGIDGAVVFLKRLHSSLCSVGVTWIEADSIVMALIASGLTHVSEAADAAFRSGVQEFIDVCASPPAAPVAAEPPLTQRNDPAAENTRDMVSRTLSVRAATLDEQNRSVECVMATEGQVMVYDWERGVIDEILVAGGGQMPAQMPMLANHARWSLDSVLGSVRNIRREGDTWVGRLFFAEDSESTRAWQKVRGGHLTDVSIGYRALEGTMIEPGQRAVVAGREYTAGRRPLRVTTRWEAKECSLVPIGADKQTKVRGEGGPSPLSPARSGKEYPMNPQLRRYLESLGLRADASVEQAQAFLAALSGEQRTRADAIGAGTMTFEQATAPPAQRSEPANPAPAAPAASSAPAAPAQPSQRSEPTPAETPEQIRAAERQRMVQIRQLAGGDTPEELVGRAINEGWTVERAGTEFLRHLRTNRSSAVPSDPAINVGQDRTRAMVELSLAAALVGHDAQRFAPRFESAILEHDPYRAMRSADAWRTAVQQSQRYAGRFGAVDFLRMAIQATGGRYDLADSPGALLRAAVSGGALSNIFTTSAYAMMMMSWDEQVDTTVGWVSEGDVANFLTHTDIDFAMDAQLKKVARGQTAPHSTASDSANTYKLVRYAKQFAVTEEDIIDDRFGALLTAPMEHGKAARRLRPQLVYSLLNQNPSFGGGDLFNNTALTAAGGHANLGATVLGADGLKAAIGLMGKQYLLQGKVKVPLNIRPQTLIVPQALQWTAQELIESEAIIVAIGGTAAGQTTLERGTKNVLKNAISRLVVDDAVGAVGTWDPSAEVQRAGSDTAYYLAAAPGRTIEVSYRRGTGRSPQLRSYVLDKGQWGIGWDINYDIEAHVKDFRGLAKGNG